MKMTLSYAITLGGLCALLAGAGTAAIAQGDDHRDRNGDPGQYGQRQFSQNGDPSQYRHSDQYRRANQNERRRLDRLHAAYARAAEHGNYGAAERAHEHAQAIRAQIHDQHRDNGPRHGGGPFHDDHQNH